jgi:MFS family permease
VYALLSFAFVLPARSALLADMTLPEERARVFGTLSAVDGISGAIGYGAAGIFAQVYGLRLSMNVAGFGLLLAALFIILFFKEKRRA